MSVLVNSKKWTRQCSNFKQAVSNTAIRLNIPESVVKKTVMQYLHKCKLFITMGKRVRFPGILYMSAYPQQLKTLRRFMNYKQLKIAYGNKEYFKRTYQKSKNVNK